MTSESMRVWRSGRSHLSLFLLTERERDLDALRARCLERERERERLFEPQNTQKQKRETDVDVQPSLKCTISKRNEEPRNSNRSLIWKYIPTSPQTCIKQCDDAIYSQKCNYSFEFQYHLHKQPSGGGVTGNLGVYCDHTHTHTQIWSERVQCAGHTWPCGLVFWTSWQDFWTGARGNESVGLGFGIWSGPGTPT